MSDSAIGKARIATAEDIEAQLRECFAKNRRMDLFASLIEREESTAEGIPK